MAKVEYEYNGEQVRAALHDHIDKTFARGAYTAEGVAKKRANVATGRMRAATHTTKVEEAYYVLHNDVHYSIHQEMGWVHSPGQAFMRPGYRSGRDQILRELRRVYG